MTPPRREAALKSVAVTGTDNVGQGFRPNLTTIQRTHQPPTSQRDGGQNRKARQRPDPGRSTKAPPPRMPPTQTIPLPAQPRPLASTHTMEPAARRHRAHHPEPPLRNPGSQPNSSPSGERAARTQPASPAAARAHLQHLQPLSATHPTTTPAPNRTAQPG
jgi:hypothetical protein